MGFLQAVWFAVYIIYFITIVPLPIWCQISFESDIVKTSNGYIRGKTLDINSIGKKVLSFRGIPYGKAPIGNLRFKHPLPADPWDEVLNATEYGPTCYQKNFYYFKNLPGFDRLNPKTKFSEDCLTLNVFVPVPYPKTSAVMVFVHGGGFAIGGTSGVMYDGQYLAAQENVIVVSMNYRIASLGFLYVNHPEMDANCGLMDQVLALKWINENIGNFGGNPEEVTLFGQSAGAISIGYHLVSPLTKGLFNKAILQSGSPFLEWILQDKEENEEFAVETGKNLNCQQHTDPNFLVKCLKNINPEKLVNKEPKRRLMPFIFKPVIDGKFLVEDPLISAKNGNHFKNISIMIGTVRDESTWFLALYHPLIFLPLVDRIAPYHNEVMDVMRFYLPNQCESFYKSVENLYTDWDNYNKTQTNLKIAVKCMNDYVFTCPQKHFSEFYSSNGNDVYGYHFTYRSPSIDFVKWLGVPHTEELRYLMGEVAAQKKFSEKEKQFSFRLTRYWANFARTGNPNLSPSTASNKALKMIRWPKFNLNSEILVLEPQSNETLRLTDTKECTFWKNYPQIRENSKQNKCSTKLKLRG